MAQAEQDARWMRRALELARGAEGLASPNPQVGCVLVRPGEGVVLGEGAHRYDDRDHAEIVALQAARAAGHDVRGATAYVTLEPCAHHGRTGPCAVALREAGVARCVVATADPNPLVSGRGLAILREAGVAVTVSVLEAEARRLVEAFAFAVQHGRPFVTLKAAVSADGALAPPAEQRLAGSPVWLTGTEARAEVHRLRHGADALVTGIGTVLADDPLLTDRSGRARRRPLLRVVLDARLRLPVTSQMVRSAADDVLVVCGEDALQEREGALRAAGVAVVRTAAGPGGRVSLPRVLALLEERQCRSVLLEAGAELNGAFLREALVDRVALFFAPMELGVGAVPFAAGGPSPYVLERRLSEVERTLFGRDELVTGLLHPTWPQDEFAAPLG